MPMLPNWTCSTSGRKSNMLPIKIAMMAGGTQGIFKRTLMVMENLVGGRNLRDIANEAGYDGERDTEINFWVPAGHTIYAGIDSGVWPVGFAHTIHLLSLGWVNGAPGIGGFSGTFLPANGGAGGAAIFCRLPMTIEIGEFSHLRGGAGGGGQGGSWAELQGPPGEQELIEVHGGAGGNGYSIYSAGSPKGGFGAGNGGDGGLTAATAGQNGAVATKTGAAVTVYGPGFGGAAGAAIQKNGYAVTVNINGAPEITGAIVP